MDASSENEAIISGQLTQQIEDLSIDDDNTEISICANCGNEGTNMNTCNKCKAATYCNASCKKKHRKQHKKKCEMRVAELHEEELQRKKRTDELHDINLFKQPPPPEDCPICMLPIPSLESGSKYNSCCGKRICSGCIIACAIRDKNEHKCPFCRTPAPRTDKEIIKRTNKRVELWDAASIYTLGCHYYHTANGLPHDYDKALELWHQAVKFGHARAYFNIGQTYINGDDVERDMKKAIHYCELAAMGGEIISRHHLGVFEMCDGNMDRALKHFLLATGGGSKKSLSIIQEMFKAGHATKEDYTQALREYQAYLGEVKSAQRSAAAAYSEEYKYYE